MSGAAAGATGGGSQSSGSSGSDGEVYEPDFPASDDEALAPPAASPAASSAHATPPHQQLVDLTAADVAAGGRDDEASGFGAALDAADDDAAGGQESPAQSAAAQSEGLGLQQQQRLLQLAKDLRTSCEPAKWRRAGAASRSGGLSLHALLETLLNAEQAELDHFCERGGKIDGIRLLVRARAASHQYLCVAASSAASSAAADTNCVA
eukprot:SAG22_NODE_4216_length_1340_cov_1.432716_2_plen_208_part_00